MMEWLKHALGATFLFSMLLSSSCAAPDIPSSCQQLSHDRRMSILAELLRNDVDIRELTFSVTEDSQNYVIIGHLTEPAIGFEPTIQISKSDCSARVIEWR